VNTLHKGDNDDDGDDDDDDDDDDNNINYFKNKILKEEVDNLKKLLIA
jgi:hypothetical protein